MNLASIFEVKTQNQTSGSLDSKSMGVATRKTPLHPLIASSNLPSSFRSAFHGIRCVVDALGNSNKCFTFFIISKINTQKTPPKRKKKNQNLCINRNFQVYNSIYSSLLTMYQLVYGLSSSQNNMILIGFVPFFFSFLTQFNNLKHYILSYYY